VKGNLSKKLIKGEKGQALLIVLLVILFSGLVLPPLLSYMSSGLKTGREVFEDKMYLSYAADAGIEDGLWQVKAKQLTNLLTDYEQYAYYDYDPAYEWQYDLADRYGENGIVNNNDVEVSFQNVWMPKDINAPDVSEAESIAEEGRLVIYGMMSGSSPTEYQVKLIYYYNNQYPGQPDYDPTGENLRVQKIGIWLPPGFDYNDSLAGAPTSPSTAVDPYKGGTAVVWNFPSSPNYPRLKDFPLGTSSVNPIVRYITFQFTGPEGRTPGTALSWLTTTGVSTISYSWDCSVKVYKIISEATDEGGKQVTAEAYAATTDMLKRGSAICGDYCAIGGTLMTTTTDQYYRDRLFKESSATAQSSDSQAPFYIPSNAHLDLAYFYWSGWLQNAAIWGDSCNDFTNWVQDNDWTIYGWFGDWQFRGHNSGGTRNLAMDEDLDLSAYIGQTVQVSWAQSEGGTLEGSGQYIDGLDFAFSADGGNSWGASIQAFRDDNPPSSFSYDIPSQYITSQFRMRFSLVGCSEYGEYVYVDDISISLVVESPVENARVNQIMFNGVKLTAEPINIQTQAGTVQGSLSYSCFYDATPLVIGMIGSGALGSNGSGTYTVGHVLDWPGEYQMYNYPEGTSDGTTAYPLGTPAYQEDGEWVVDTQWSYAAWSLVIVYSSPETQGHQLYLYDNFAYAESGDNLDFDGDGHAGGTIGGFIAPEAIRDEAHAAHLTCFVGEGDDVYDGDYVRVNGTKIWDGTVTGGNSQSNPNDVWNSHSLGLIQSGIDIDTFTVAYPVIKPGDVSAQVDMYTPMDCFNLVYIILSFRSDIIPASTVSYLLR
jgi:hypothetical protein